MDILTEIKLSGKTFVIAEIGQNHQGNLDTAKLLIKAAKVSNLIGYKRTLMSVVKGSWS